VSARSPITLPRTETPPLDDAAVDRLWGGIGQRRRAGARRRQALAAVATAGGLVALVLVAMGRHATPVARSGVTATSGPLTMAGGGGVGVLSGTDHAERFALSDASRIELARGARLEAKANSGTAFTAHLDGTATFEVTPGGPRRWSIECGAVTVDVSGTRFRVEEDGSGQSPHVRVSVEHGIVLVRSDAVPNHVQRLVDGQSSDVTGEAPAPASPIAPAAAVPSAHPDARPASRTWHELARGGDYDGAYRQLGPTGVAAEASRASVEDLLALADIARLSAHPADAVGPLSRVLDEHGGDPRAPLAAFTLGRIDLDTLGQPAAAATAFQRAIRLGLPEGLTEDAYARLVEADAKAGEPEAARAARDEYERKYPHGSRSSTMRAWVPGVAGD
jgi:transmembrane sensor